MLCRARRGATPQITPAAGPAARLRPQQVAATVQFGQLRRESRKNEERQQPRFAATTAYEKRRPDDQGPGGSGHHQHQGMQVQGEHRMRGDEAPAPPVGRPAQTTCLLEVAFAGRCRSGLFGRLQNRLLEPRRLRCPRSATQKALNAEEVSVYRRKTSFDIYAGMMVQRRTRAAYSRSNGPFLAEFHNGALCFESGLAAHDVHRILFVALAASASRPAPAR